MNRVISSSMLSWILHEIWICLGETCAEIVYENDSEKRLNLRDKYFFYESYYQILFECIDSGMEELSWKTLMDEGKLSLANVALFKKEIVKEVGEEAWRERVIREFQYLGEEKTEMYLKEYDDMRKRIEAMK